MDDQQKSFHRVSLKVLEMKEEGKTEEQIAHTLHLPLFLVKDILENHRKIWNINKTT